MRPLLLLLLLCACGPTPYLQPSQSDSLVQAQGPSAPVDCVAICQRAKLQLVRDFDVPADQIDCWAGDYFNAHDCAACQNVFRMKYAVELTECPGTP